MVFHEWKSVCDVCITFTTKNTKLKRFNIDRRTCLTYTIYIGVYERCCVWMKLCHHVWNDGEKTTRLVTFFCLSLCEKMFIWWVDEKWCDVHSICHEVIWWLWWWMMNGGEQESQIKVPKTQKQNKHICCWVLILWHHRTIVHFVFTRKDTCCNISLCAWDKTCACLWSEENPSKRNGVWCFCGDGWDDELEEQVTTDLTAQRQP